MTTSIHFMLVALYSMCSFSLGFLSYFFFLSSIQKNFISIFFCVNIGVFHFLFFFYSFHFISLRTSEFININIVNIANWLVWKFDIAASLLKMMKKMRSLSIVMFVKLKPNTNICSHKLMSAHSDFVLFILKIDCCHNSNARMSCLHKSKKAATQIAIAIQCLYIHLPDYNNSFEFGSNPILGVVEIETKWKTILRKTLQINIKSNGSRTIVQNNTTQRSTHKRTKSNLHSIFHIR